MALEGLALVPRLLNGRRWLLRLSKAAEAGAGNLGNSAANLESLLETGARTEAPEGLALAPRLSKGRHWPLRLSKGWHCFCNSPGPAVPGGLEDMAMTGALNFFLPQPRHDPSIL